jgi:hypothetical protein
MKKIIWAAFGLLLSAPLAAQAQPGEKDNGQQNEKEAQNKSVTNVAGERIVTQPAKMENGNGAIPKEEGTDAVANSSTSSNKPKPNTSGNARTVKDTTAKRATANAKIPTGKNDKSTAGTNSSRSNNGNERLERTSRGSTPTGNAPKKNANKGRKPINTPVGKPKVHPPKAKKDVY